MTTKTEQVKEQLDEVHLIMRNNVERVLERGDQLGDLEEKSERLVQDANRFSSTSRKLKRKMWCQDKKWLLVLAVIILLVLGIIIAVAILAS